MLLPVLYGDGGGSSQLSGRAVEWAVLSGGPLGAVFGQMGDPLLGSSAPGDPYEPMGDAGDVVLIYPGDGSFSGYPGDPPRVLAGLSGLDAVPEQYDRLYIGLLSVHLRDLWAGVFSQHALCKMYLVEYGGQAGGLCRRCMSGAGSGPIPGLSGMYHTDGVGGSAPDDPGGPQAGCDREISPPGDPDGDRGLLSVRGHPACPYGGLPCEHERL